MSAQAVLHDRREAQTELFEVQPGDFLLELNKRLP
jgi:hypothetical protein